MALGQYPSANVPRSLASGLHPVGFPPPGWPALPFSASGFPSPGWPAPPFSAPGFSPPGWSAPHFLGVAVSAPGSLDAAFPSLAAKRNHQADDGDIEKERKRQRGSVNEQLPLAAVSTPAKKSPPLYSCRNIANSASGQTEAHHRADETVSVHGCLQVLSLRLACTRHG